MYTSHTHTERERQGVSNSLKIVKYALMFSLGIKFVQWRPLVRSTVRMSSTTSSTEHYIFDYFGPNIRLFD